MTALVLGGGMAGSAAALALAGEGIETVQVSTGPGATALSGGSFDVAAASPGVSALAWRDALRGSPLTSRQRLALLAASNPSHPYAVLALPGESDCAKQVPAAVEQLNRWLAPAGLSVEGQLDANHVLANTQGTVRVTDFALTGPAGGDLASATAIHVADLPLEGCDARGLARVLALELDALGLRAPPIRLARPRLPEGLVEDGEIPARLAARLDGAAERKAFAGAFAGLAGEGELILVPPVLGLASTAAVLQEVRQAAGCPVAETLGFPPHATAGLRLHLALEQALVRAGVRVIRGRTDSLAVGPDGRFLLRLDPEAVEAGAPASLEGSSVVLATGRFVGGGLAEAAGMVRETLLDLPLFDDQGRRVDGIPAHRSVRKGYANPQPLYRAGVRTDSRLRPLAENGEPRSTRLFAAGDLLGGWDPARERTGLGVALLSGLEAARQVQRVLGDPPAAGGGRGGAGGRPGPGPEGEGQGKMRGYRGFLREFSRTSSLRALALQVRTGIAHLARQAWGRPREDGVYLFLENYGPDGVRPVSVRDRNLRLRSEACLVCGLCSAECARAGGRPVLDPRDAVIAAARLEVDLLRFELAGELVQPGGPCSGCAACDRVCPSRIPIHRVQERLAGLAHQTWPPAAPDATGGGLAPEPSHPPGGELAPGTPDPGFAPRTRIG